MSTQSSMERRRFARVRADIPMVAYQNGFTERLRAVDLSAGGALVHRAGQSPPPIMQRIELRLETGRRVRGLARTIWSRRGYFAIRFVGFEDADRLEIAEQVDRGIHRGQGI
jgi:hypothetical protein